MRTPSTEGWERHLLPATRYGLRGVGPVVTFSIPAPVVEGDRLGLIVGHSLPPDSFAEGASRREITLAGHRVPLLDLGSFVVLPRHGIEHFTPAHLLPHHAQIAALAHIGCNRVLGVASAGSLRADWGVGTVVAPDDFVAPHVTDSFFDDVKGHTIPGFDPGWRREVVRTWRRATDTPIQDGGVYTQSTGPRFETAAEVRLLATFADVVGMTLVGECLLAREIGMAYAAICTVDNLANGLGDAPLTPEEFRAGVAMNQQRMRDDLDAVLPALP